MADLDGFSLFERGHIGTTGRDPAIRIDKNGNLIINAAARRLLGDVRYVHLLSDPSTKAIALRPAPGDSPISYSVRVNGPGGGAAVSARAFVAHVGIQANTIYAAELLPTGELLGKPSTKI